MVTTRIFVCSAFVLWLIGSIAGMTTLWNHEAKPGSAAAAPHQWPVDSKLFHDPSRSLMLVWIHPRCPCSRATIGQLERLLVHLPDDVDCQIVLTRPTGCDAEFVETDLSRAARRLPRVEVAVDDDQREAARFGVLTSGQVLMYGRESELLFAGGITPGRGHEGDSIGTAALRDLFAAQPSEKDTRQCSVFGCGLFAPARKQGQAQ